MTTTDGVQRTAGGAGPARSGHHGWWWRTLVVGLVLWGATVVVTTVTRNSNLVPTVILLGSFLVPFSVALFAADRGTGTATAMRFLLAFGVGGVCGVLGASLLESGLPSAVWSYLLVGGIEEFVKGALVVVVGLTVRPKTWRQGALLGATVGAGFAAFESAGYAFNAALTAQGIDIGSLVQTEVLRALLSPVGHVLWTAILGAVLFDVAALRRAGGWWRVLVAYAGVALLHALWDSSSAISSFVALLVNSRAVMDLRYGGFLPPSVAAQVTATSTWLYAVILLVAALLGVGALVLVARGSARRERREGVGARPGDR
jgi:RsiW-degrading membrane proteinase PrsW (M82 family)